MRGHVERTRLPPLVDLFSAVRRSVCKKAPAERSLLGAEAVAVDGEQDGEAGKWEIITCVTCGCPLAILGCESQESVISADMLNW